MKRDILCKDSTSKPSRLEPKCHVVNKISKQQCSLGKLWFRFRRIICISFMIQNTRRQYYWAFASPAFTGMQKLWQSNKQTDIWQLHQYRNKYICCYKLPYRGFIIVFAVRDTCYTSKVFNSGSKVVWFPKYLPRIFLWIMNICDRIHFNLHFFSVTTFIVFRQLIVARFTSHAVTIKRPNIT